MVELPVSTADWKTEKHAPVIELLGAAKKSEPVKVNVSVGKQIPHPNTTEHHIAWIHVYFIPEGEKFPVELAKLDFTCHGASTKGPNSSTIFTTPEGTVSFKSEKSGTVIAISYCNIHGLWKAILDVKLE